MGISSEESRSPCVRTIRRSVRIAVRRPTGVGVDVYSDDHIFMDAIGGRKTVRVCKPCNDRCGGTFEARNLKETIIRFSILLAKADVPVAKKGLKWKNAVSRPTAKSTTCGDGGWRSNRIGEASRGARP